MQDRETCGSVATMCNALALSCSGLLFTLVLVRCLPPHRPCLHQCCHRCRGLASARSVALNSFNSCITTKLAWLCCSYRHNQRKGNCWAGLACNRQGEAMGEVKCQGTLEEVRRRAANMKEEGKVQQTIGFLSVSSRTIDEMYGVMSWACSGAFGDGRQARVAWLSAVSQPRGNGMWCSLGGRSP